jgi:hypothetical protein
MKYSRILAALVAVTFVACSKKKDDDPSTQYPVIPQDVTFDKAGLQPISDADFNAAKSVLKTLNNLTSFEDQLATKYADDQGRQSNQEEFNKMTPAQQAIVLRKQQDCTVEEDKKETDLGENAQPGANATGYEKARIYGPLCGSDSTKNVNSLITLLAIDKSALTFDIGLKSSIALKTEITNIADQAVLGYSSVESNFQADGRVAGSFMAPQTYLHSSGNMLWKTAQAGEILMNLSLEILIRGDKSSIAKTQMIMNFQGRQVQITLVETKGAGGISGTDEVYFGNHLLTAAERAEVGDFSFGKKMVQKQDRN